MGDAQRLRQVLENLVGNALKFTHRGSVSVRGGEMGEGRVRFEVVDTGPGMTAEDMGRLFQPFSQAVTGRPPEPGAGLGLAISQHLVGLMGGRIEVESQPGAGSRFTFDVRLPRVESSNASTSEAGSDGRVIGYSGPRRRVLVVDDVEINRRLLRELFEPLGFGVMEAASGEAALEAVRGGGLPDLVILDLRMPGMDGLELTRRLRQDGRFAGRILAMSASVLGFGRTDALASGADDFVGKPFAEEALLAVVGVLLGVDWQREAGMAARVESAGVGDPATQPSEELLEPLRSAASRGDIVEFRKLLADAKVRAPEHEAFFRQLEAMAAAYRMAALREVLTQRKEAP
jgi:CheY-like chemotaxis protein